jgi:hypothetical protein
MVAIAGIDVKTGYFVQRLFAIRDNLSQTPRIFGRRFIFFPRYFQKRPMPEQMLIYFPDI